MDGSLTQNEAVDRFAALLGDAEKEERGDDADNVEDIEGEEVEGDEPDADAGETEGEEEADDEESEERDARGGEQTFSVKVSGEDLQVPLSELLNGYSRQADYTRKSMAVAQFRKELESRAAALESERAQMIQFLEGQVAAAQQQQPQEPDWEHLRREDPIEYAAQWAAFQQRQQRQYALHHRLQSEQAKARQAEHEQLQVTLAEEADRLMQAIPEWRDEKRVVQEKAGMAEFARGLGFTEQELSSIYDHRTVLVLRQAYLYDQMQKRQPSLKAEAQQRRVAPRVAPAGSTLNRDAVPVQKAVKKLAQSGSVKDAAAVFARLL